MKFAMLIVESEEERASASDAVREFETLAQWWADLRLKGKIVASARLAPTSSARTISWREKIPVVTDGPYVEAKESVGGVLIVDVASEAEAMDIARTWPAPTRWRIEVRPVLDPP